MENVIFTWASTQSWWGLATTIIVIANGITMTLRDKYAENIPILGKIWPILNWLSLNIANNKNDDKQQKFYYESFINCLGGNYVGSDCRMDQEVD